MQPVLRAAGFWLLLTLFLFLYSSLIHGQDKEPAQSQFEMPARAAGSLNDNEDIKPKPSADIPPPKSGHEQIRPELQKKIEPSIRRKLPAVQKGPAAGGLVPDKAARKPLKDKLPANIQGTNAVNGLRGNEIRVDGVNFLARPISKTVPGSTATTGPITLGNVNYIATPLSSESPSHSASESSGAEIRLNSVHFIATPVSGR